MRFDFNTNVWEVKQIIIEKGEAQDSHWLSVNLLGFDGQEQEIFTVFPSRKLLPPILFKWEGEEDRVLIPAIEVPVPIEKPEDDILF